MPAAANRNVLNSTRMVVVNTIESRVRWAGKVVLYITF